MDEKIVIPLGLFVLAQLVSLAVYLWQRNQKSAEKEEFYFNFLNKLIEPLERQISFLQDISDRLKTDVDESIIYQRVSNIFLETLNETPKNEAYYLFVRRKKGKDNINNLGKLLRYLDIANRIIERGEKSHSQYYGYLDPLQKEFDENVQHIITLRDNLFESSKRQNETDPFLKNFFSIVQVSMSKPYKISDINETLIVPLLELCKSEGSHRSILVPYVVKSNDIYKRILGAKAYFSELFLTYSKTLSEAKEGLLDVANKLKSSKTKIFFKSGALAIINMVVLILIFVLLILIKNGTFIQNYLENS